MDENEQTFPELDLEEIMKEFGGGTPEEPPEPSEEPVEAPIPEPEPAEPPTPQVQLEEEPSEEPEIPELRIPELGGEGPFPEKLEMPELEEAPSEAEAPEEPLVIQVPDLPPEDAREPAPEPMDKTRTFQPAPEPRPARKPPEKAEPYSEAWEPEYEQPIGDYIPPEPILFRPKSRLRELKRKLIAGPEKRYYELSEEGLGKRQAALFICTMIALLSAGATLLYGLGMVQENRLRLMVFGQFFALLLSALVGNRLLLNGLFDLFRGRFSLNAMLVFTFAACCADGVFGLRELRVPCCAAFSLEMTMALWSDCQTHTVEMGQMDTMRKATRLNSLVREPDYLDGQPGILRGEGEVEDFMDTYELPSPLEKIRNWYVLAALLVSIAAGILAGVLHGVSLGVQVLAVTSLAAIPASFFVAMSRPMAVLERRLHSLGAVLCGWQGVEGLAGKITFPLGHNDLFPAGSIKMNGVKFYGSRDTDEVVAYSTALINANGGGLAPLFNQLLDSRNGRHYDVANLQLYGNGGIGGEVNEEPVLVGMLPFMQEMGVEIPEGTRVNQGVYVAIDGQLCGLFALTYHKVASAAAGITTLCAYRKLRPVLTTGDFVLTDDFIRSKFGVDTSRIEFPKPELRMALDSREAAPDAPALALTTQEGLAPMAFAVTGARALRTASQVGLIVHMLGGIVGMVMMLILAVLGAGQLLTPANLFLYHLIWMIPGLLITEWTRVI